MNISTLGGHAVPVEELKLDLLTSNAKHRIAVNLAEDAMGRPIRVPVLVARGRRPGPVVGFTAALHGNELNGIPVLHRLFAELEPARLRGTVVGVVVANVPGYLMRQREFNDGADLNHLFPGVPDGNLSQMWAHRLLDRVVSCFEVLVDLHTASFVRVNSLYVRADMTNPATARMAYRLRPEIILHNPPSDRTLRGSAQGLGIPSVTLEIGNPHRFQRRFIKQARLGLLAVLADAGVISRKPLREGPEPLLCSGSGWVYTDRGGLLQVLPEILDRVEAGSELAVQTNVFGDVVRRYRAPHDGVVIGRSVDPVGQSGARIAHLGVLAPEDHGFVRRKEA